MVLREGIEDIVSNAWYAFSKKLLTLSSAVILSYCTLSYADTQTQPEESREVVVFVSGMSGVEGLYVMNSDGSDVKPVMERPIPVSHPSLSCNGEIVFQGYDPASNLYIINLDGSGLTKLTDSQVAGAIGDLTPEWDEKGERVAFARNMSRAKIDICVINHDGTGFTNLTGGNYEMSHSPSFSPDGSKIAFASQFFVVKKNKSNEVTLNDSNIYVVSSQGKGQPTQITFERNAREPTWSPDGKWIACVSEIAFKHPEIFIMDETGRSKRRLTYFHRDNEGKTSAEPPVLKLPSNPDWSPSGEEIIFELTQTKRDASIDLYKISLSENSTPVQITSQPYDEKHATWSKILKTQ